MPNEDPEKKQNKKERRQETEQRNDEDTGPPVGEQEDVNEPKTEE